MDNQQNDTTADGHASALAVAPCSVILTIDQIRDLALMAGLRVEGELTHEDRETEIAIERCSPRGVDDDGVTRHYRHIAYFEEYPEEGVTPLGEEILPNNRDVPTRTPPGENAQ